MDTYIEVVGSASFVESVVEYNADITLTVRATLLETAMEEAVALRSDCIRALRAAGLGEGELKEGAAEIWRPWFWKKKPGQDISLKLLATCEDIQRLYKAFGSLEPLFQNTRHSLSVSMRPPRFAAPDHARATAQQAAIAAAKENAAVIAAAAGVTLAGVIRVEDIGEHASGSGSYGDHDWMGGPVFAMAAAAPDNEDAPPSLESASRNVKLRYRVRFGIRPGV